PLDQLDLANSDRRLAGDGAREVDGCAPLGDEQPDELVPGHERHRQPGRPAAAGELGPELGESEGAPALAGRARRAPVELLAAGLEQVDVARLRAQELAG